jgi:hypothetical protein
MTRTKCCTQCNVEKPFSLFGKSERNKNIRKSTCKACVYERQKEWGEQNAARNRTNWKFTGGRTCLTCKVEKEAVEFGRRAKSKTGIDSTCLECLRAKDRRRYREKTVQRKAQAKWGALKMKFGLSKERWKDMLDSQGGLCAICSVLLDRPCVDHDHETGVVRGFLCVGCNTGIGSLGDSPARLESAAMYLRKHGK